MTHPQRVAAAVESACRRDSGRIVATLTRVLGSLDAAEDVLQSTFAKALVEWERRGIPSNPAAWLTTVAKRAAIDAIRHRKIGDRVCRRIERERRAGYDPVTRQQPHSEDPYDILARWPDERLKLMFMCCHPTLDTQARVALTLREVCGLSTDAIAGTFLVSDAAMAQRLVRAKRKLRDADAAFEIPEPDVLPERVGDVLQVLYLVFNEGYLPKAGDEILRGELCEEAIFLTRLIVAELEMLGQEIAAEPRGLLALMVLTHSRRRARVAEDGLSVTLEEQDRSLWIDSEATEGLAVLDRAIAARSPGPYQLKAAISALHHTATDRSDTDWKQIHALYRELLTYEPTPVVRLNAIVALGMWQGPAVALEALASPEAADPANPRAAARRETVMLASALESYPYYHLAEARFLEGLGRFTEAVDALRRAKASSTNGAEQRFIDRRILELERRGD